MSIIDTIVNSYHGIVWKLLFFIILPVIIIDFVVHKLPLLSKAIKKLIVWLIFLGWLMFVIQNDFLKFS